MLKDGFQTLAGDTLYNLLARTWFVTTAAERTAKRVFWVATGPAKTPGFKCGGRRGGEIERDNQRSLPPWAWLEPAGQGELEPGKGSEWAPAPW